MLKVDLDQQHRNYVDYIVPFVIDILNDDKPEIINDSTVADKLLGRFGLQVPTKAVQHVLRRLQRKGYVAPEDGIFFATAVLPKSEIGATQNKAKLHIDSVITAIIEESRSHGLNWSPEEAIRAVTSFLGKFTVDCLKTYVFNTALPKIPEKRLDDLYVVGRFVTKAQERNDPAFESFIVLVKGLMYSNALLCPDLESLEKKFQDLTFFLDTPIVLNLVDLQGKDAKRAASELVSLLAKLKGSIAVFSHTLHESQIVISAAIANLNNPRATGKVVEEARRNSVQLSDLILVRDTLDERLRQVGVSVKKTTEYKADFQINELELQAILSEAIIYKVEAALLNDINSVRSIYVLRKGKHPVRLEDAGAVFVTTNEAFARAAFKAGKNHNSTREVSSVITAYSLANIAWLKSPLAAPNLPLSETMAMCYAALEPSPELFKKYVEEMDKLLESGQITSRDHEILRVSPSAREELMELTLGDEHALTVSSIKNILANVKANILAEQEIAHQAKLFELSEERASHLSETQKRELELTERTFLAEAAAEDLRNQVNQLATRQAARARSIARAATNVLTVAAVGTLILGALASSGLLSVPKSASLFAKGLIVIFIIFAVAWGVYSWHTGATTKGIFLTLEDRIAKYLQNKFV